MESIFLLLSIEHPKKAGRETKARNDFDENNDMQKYRIKNQFNVESFSIL